MTAETLTAYTIAALIFAATPGPGVFATIAQAMSRGVWPAYLMLTGLIVGDIVYLAAAAYGLGFIAEYMGEFFMVVRFLGAGYLIWLGYTSWRAPVAEDADKPIPAHRGRSLLAGLGIGLGNPKVIVFYLAFLPTFVNLATISHGGVAMLALITAVASYLVLSVYILAAARLRTAIRKPSVRKIFNRVSGGMLMGTGAALAAKG